MSSTNGDDMEEIYRTFRKYGLEGKLKRSFGKTVSLDKDSIKHMKDTYKSGIWRIQLSVQDRTIPIILKCIKAGKVKREKSIVEINMYRKSTDLLKGMIPRIFLVQSKVDGDHVWVFMEYVPQLENHVKATPRVLEKIIPVLARLHARTFERRFHRHRKLFTPWFPQYLSREMRASRERIRRKTMNFLEAAMKRSDLRTILEPSYSVLMHCLRKGPAYFPEVIRAGQSIIHNDLVLRNIGSNDSDSLQWRIRFIDWESASFAPCWFDLVNLVTMFLKEYPQWKRHERGIIHKCSKLYAREMRNRGIRFKDPPIKLYKMAYLQRVLEMSLYVQLRSVLKDKDKKEILEEYIRKLNSWGKQLGLH